MRRSDRHHPLHQLGDDRGYPARLAELTWVEAEAARVRQPVVLIPVGAIEAHGPHLPLATDAILSDELATRAAAALAAVDYAVLIAPTLGYAITDYAASFSGSISLTVDTATALYVDVCVSLIEQGFTRLCWVNSHLEPAHVSSLVAACRRTHERTGVAPAFANQLDPRWARTLGDEFKRGACHAGSYETSLMLAARPELVHERRRALPPLPIDLAQAMRAGKRTFIEAGASAAYFGDPAAATVEEGNRLYALLTTMIIETVRARWPSESAVQP
jgi:creatinine amidohydrolase